MLLSDTVFLISAKKVLCIDGQDVKLVLSGDGTEIDSTEVLEHFASELFLLLRPGEEWANPSLLTSSLPHMDKVTPAPPSVVPSTPVLLEPQHTPVQQTDSSAASTPTYQLNSRPDTPPPDDDRSFISYVR